MSDEKPEVDGDSSTDDERWMVIDGRRWRRTDPILSEEVVAALKSHLGRGRSGVRAGKKNNSADEIATARSRVDRAKHGLGERGPYWWEEAESDRQERAQRAVDELDALD